MIIIVGIATFFWVKDIPEEVRAHPQNIPEGLEELKTERRNGQLQEPVHG